MSALDCIAEINKAVGRELSDEELDFLETKFQQRIRQKQTMEQGLSAEEAILEAANELGDELIATAKIEKRNAALNLKSKLQAIDFVKSGFAKKPELGLEAMMTGVNAAKKGARRSAAAEQKQLAGFYTQGLIADVEKAGLWRVFVSGELDDEIARAMWFRETPGPKQSKHAEQLADIFHKWQEFARVDANKAGAAIRKMPGYVVRQSHDMFRIRSVPYEEWRDFVAKRLDPRTFDDIDDVDGFLSSVYEGLASGVHMTHAGNSVPTGLKGFGNVAKRMSQDRVLHFASADDWLEYNSRFGTGSLRESLLFGLERSANNTALMRRFGPNPEATYDAVFQEIMAGLDASQKAKFKETRGWLDNRFVELTGEVNIPGNMMAAKWSAGFRAWQSMAKLGGATLSAFGDVPLSASELRYQGVGFLDSYRDSVQNLTKGRSKGEKAEILGMLGVAMDGMKGSVVHRFSGHDDLPGKMSKLMRTYFKWNGLTWWTDRVREAAGFAMSHRLALNSSKSWDALDPDLQRVLQLFDLDSGRWDLLRSVETKLAEDTRFMVPEAAREIDPEAARGYLKGVGRKGTDAQVRNLKEELESQLRSYFADRAEYAALNPDARTNAILRRGTKPGTIEGELLRFITQFKSFPVAIVQKTLGRELYGRGADIDASFFQALRHGHGEASGLVNVIIATTVFGYIAMTAKDLAKGRTPRDPGDPKSWVTAMAQGGGAGIYGDFILGNIKERFGGGAIQLVAGPVAGAGQDFFDVIGRMRDGDKAAAKFVATIIDSVPGANMFYLRMGLDYLILHRLREAMSPGYMRRTQRRIKRETGQSFLLVPSVGG